VRSKSNQRRQIFVLTPEEKRTACFILATFVLGITTQHYRGQSFVPAAKTAVHETTAAAARPAPKRADSRKRKPTP